MTAVTSELAAAVARLKAEAARPTQDAAVLRGRLDTLWEWSNAYVQAGGTMPNDYPWMFGACSRSVSGAAARQVTLEQVSDFIARSVHELEIKENPRAVGSLTLSPEGPFTAGEHVTLTLTYTVGEMPMAPGGGVVLSRGWGVIPQTDRPAAETYVTARCSRSESRLAPAAPWGQWEGFLFRGPVAFRLEGAALVAGDTITVTFGDTSGGSRGMPVQEWTNDRVVLPCAVDLEGAGVILTPQWPSFAVTGRSETRYVNCLAPSVVAAGAPFRIAVRSEDRFKNPIGGRAPGYEVSLDGKPFAQLPPADRAVSLVADVRIDQPGVHRFTVRTGDGAIEGVSNPVWVVAGPGQRIYWGDTHGHIGFADGQGGPEGYFRYGRDVAMLDFLTLSEHDVWTDAREWEQLQETTARYLAPGTFTTFLGYEWSASSRVGGHHNVYFRTAAGRQRVSHQQVLDLAELYAGLRRVHDPEDVLVIPHAHMPGDWRSSDAAMERLVELTSGHGSFEWFGNRYLENGFEVGFIGSSDNHSGHPGYTPGTNTQLGGLAAVFAAENTPQALFEALRSRACYATTGERIIVDASLNDTPMGRRAPDAQERRLRCRVMGTAPIDTIDVIKNGAVVYSKRYLGTSLGDRARVQVRFASSSEGSMTPEGPSRPRGGRDWRGVIEVIGARLEGFDEPWYAGPPISETNYQRGPDVLTGDPADPNLVRFSWRTHGRGKSVVLELEGATPETEIVVRLDEGPAPAVGARQGRSSLLPATEVAFRLSDLTTGPAARQLSDGLFLDSIELQLVPGDAALDQEFEYLDLGDRTPGDYYYLRVEQVDGAAAWSSPWWVGLTGDAAGR